MGAKKQRLERFLREHPWCIFCGGLTPAVTQDHVPPRGIFTSKKWPQGYVFAACAECNNGAARDDALVAFLARIDTRREPTETEHAEWDRLLRALKEQYPGIARQMVLGANDVRRWMDRHKVAKPPGIAFGEVPIIKIPDVIVEAVGRFKQNDINNAA